MVILITQCFGMSVDSAQIPLCADPNNGTYASNMEILNIRTFGKHALQLKVCFDRQAGFRVQAFHPLPPHVV